jgi:phosphoglycerate kinase
MASASSATSTLRPVRTVRDAEVVGKRVLVRADLNVPIKNGVIGDDTRIRAALPTLELLRDGGAAAIDVCSHLGRPVGFDAALSMTPVARRLAELFDGPLRVLENTRFNPGETKNDPAYAAELADGHDLFVEDAFGSIHRAHASTVGVAELLPSYAGLLVEQELRHLGRLLDAPERPFVVILGGAKVADKLPVLAHLATRADVVLVGGKMAEELRTTDSPLDVVLPIDVIAASAFERDADANVFPAGHLPAGWIVVDIGPETIRCFGDVIQVGHTVFWNGPVGVFEWPAFAHGTHAVAAAVAHADAYSVVGGGDSLRALNDAGVMGQISWASTGGGASLELLSGIELPGLAVIPSPSP